MAVHKSAIVKTLATGLRIIQFLGAIVLLAVWSTYLARLHTRHEGTTRNSRFVEGISGAAILYTAFAVLLTCCLGGIRIFAYLAIVIDVFFVGFMIAVAVITRGGGTSKCYFSPTSTQHITYEGRVINVSPKQLRTDCHLVKAVFAVSILMAYVFLLTWQEKSFIANNLSTDSSS
jgi:hypothetical protein